jgi:hypothetical protein
MERVVQVQNDSALARGRRKNLPGRAFYRGPAPPQWRSGALTIYGGCAGRTQWCSCRNLVCKVGVFAHSIGPGLPRRTAANGEVGYATIGLRACGARDAGSRAIVLCCRFLWAVRRRIEAKAGRTRCRGRCSRRIGPIDAFNAGAGDHYGRNDHGQCCGKDFSAKSGSGCLLQRPAPIDKTCRRHRPRCSSVTKWVDKSTPSHCSPPKPEHDTLPQRATADERKARCLRRGSWRHLMRRIDLFGCGREADTAPASSIGGS